MNSHPSPTLDAEFEVATRAALAAGEVLAAAAASPHEENHKAARNIVTEMDLASEKLLREVLCGPFPDYGFVAEESARLSDLRKEAAWIVDPLDATTNYARGYPLYCVSIALKRGEALTLGVVYNPASNELFAAHAGGGATLNGKPIHVSDTAELENALLATGFPYEASTNPRSNTAELERLIRRTRSVRVDGSAALDLCHVAAGRLDGYWEADLGPWDIAAGALIVREAGGVVTQVNGAPFAAELGNALACSPALHTQVLEVLRLPD